MTSYMNSCLHVWIWSCDEVRDVSTRFVMSSEKSLLNIFFLNRYEEFKFGCTSLRVPPDLLYQIRHDITVSPNGVAFVKVILSSK